jgi:hypothetical protein
VVADGSEHRIQYAPGMPIAPSPNAQDRHHVFRCREARGINGAQLAVEARKLRPDLRILLTSGYVGHTSDHQVLDQSLTMLNKPYRRDKLAEKLRLVLGESHEAAMRARPLALGGAGKISAPPIWFQAASINRLSWPSRPSSSVTTLKRAS